MSAARVLVTDAGRGSAIAVIRSLGRRGLHVIAADLRRGPWQQSLFDPPDAKLEAIARVKREINELHGRWKLRSGSTPFANAWYDDPANEHEVCDIRGKFCF